MTRDEVIKGMECCEKKICTFKDADECPYWELCGEYENAFEECTTALVKDALALLKAQEAVKPVVDIDTWECGNCGHTLEHQQLLGDNVLFHEQYNYCPECGRAVKWDG